MANISKSGFWLWEKTTVENNGKTDIYSGNVEIIRDKNKTCVIEKGFLTEKATCYLNDETTVIKEENTRKEEDCTICKKVKSILN